MDRYKLQELLEWLRRNQQGMPPFGSYPGDPEGREPKPPYKPPFGTYEMPGISGEPPQDGSFNRRRPRWPDWEGGRPIPMPDHMPGKIPDWWNRGERFPMHLPDSWGNLLNTAQMGSELRRENMMIPPGKRKRYPAEFDPATGQNRVVPGTLKTSYPNEERMRGPQLGGVPEGDRKFVDTMHNIQNAYFTGADFGYEEGWPEQLGATQEQIDMFMAVPEEAIRHAMENPTDAVLQQFEEYYGFPLNVNDPDMQKYFEDRKKKR